MTKLERTTKRQRQAWARWRRTGARTAWAWLLIWDAAVHEGALDDFCERYA